MICLPSFHSFLQGLLRYIYLLYLILAGVIPKDILRMCLFRVFIKAEVNRSNISSNMLDEMLDECWMKKWANISNIINVLKRRENVG